MQAVEGAWQTIRARDVMEECENFLISCRKTEGICPDGKFRWQGARMHP
ncbi:MAG: hypothetical protein UH211_00360 [Agathobacter sp.]|nr:hypothetical protein [Agathobacter sp.]